MKAIRLVIENDKKLFDKFKIIIIIISYFNNQMFYEKIFT